LPIGKEIFRLLLRKRLGDKISEMTYKSRGFLSRYRSLETTEAKRGFSRANRNF